MYLMNMDYLGETHTSTHKGPTNCKTQSLALFRGVKRGGPFRHTYELGELRRVTGRVGEADGAGWVGFERKKY